TINETNKIIEQNNYTNIHLQTIGSQLSRIKAMIQKTNDEINTENHKTKPLFTPHTIEITKNKIITNLCYDFSDAFWHQKRHMVSLPYEKIFFDQLILIKARLIQITHELMEHCKLEIEELLNKKLIRHSKSPWSCATFLLDRVIKQTIRWLMYSDMSMYINSLIPFI
ncbi:hypothetical protein CFOL_v3_18287, partial [Cephalotus follicularis]